MPSPVCRRCGQCCLSGGPALHLEDLHLLTDRSGSTPGAIRREHLVTLRTGEPVHENVAGAVGSLHSELIKVGWAGNGFCCRYFLPEVSACSIHETRPAECRALFCEDTAAIESLYNRDRIQRSHLVDTKGGLWELIAFHEEMFPAARATLLARAARTDSHAASELAALIEAENRFRASFASGTGASKEEMDFLFGRSIEAFCAPFAASSD